MAGMKCVSDDDIVRWIFEETVRLKESLVMKVSTKKLFLYAMILVQVNLNLVKKIVAIIRNM